MKYADCFEPVCTHKALALAPKFVPTCEFCNDGEPATKAILTECCGLIQACDLAAEYIFRKGHCLMTTGMPYAAKEVDYYQYIGAGRTDHVERSRREM